MPLNLRKQAGKLAKRITRPKCGPSKPGQNELKAILREGIFEFKKLLESIPPTQRGVLYSAYLDNIRRTTCVFHMATDILASQHTSEPVTDAKGKDEHYLVPPLAFIEHLYRFAS